MPRVRANTAAKWVRRAGSATQEYAEGVAAPRTSWSAATTAAAASYEAGVQDSIRDKRFNKGVAAAGDAKWAAKAAGKGATRFGPGVADAESDYAKAVQPYLDVISNLQLPPRGPKGDPKNIARVAAVATALRNKKLGK